MLSVGIVGLPNVGKSTLFNALTSGHANVSNYPFTTIDSNLGVVPVPDPRLLELERMLEPEECTPCTVEFIDIAGLVEGASRGEGLGNQFLGAIRQVDAIAHVLRCFEEGDVAHVFAAVDPTRDAKVVETELLLADLEVLKRAREKRQRQWKADPKAHGGEQERLELYQAKLEEGVPLRSLDLERMEKQELKALGMLTGKPILYVANVSEEGYGSPETAEIGELWDLGAWPGVDTPAQVVPISAKIEWELQQLEIEERAEFMTELGIETSGLDRLAAASFELLGLIRFYTLANRKLRAWEIEAGTAAPEAAGKIHTDMQTGFIRAQVASFEQMKEYGGFQELHHHGLLRTEGKEYRVQDGDVVEFLFSS
ncbi:MAG: redox-regulated ATPase YchF [Thermoanaerobaculia bacterium]